METWLISLSEFNPFGPITFGKFRIIIIIIIIKLIIIIIIIHFIYIALFMVLKDTLQ